MTNPNKGEITLANGFVMKLDFNALAIFEAETGKNALTFMDSMAVITPSVTDLRALFYAGLKRKQPDITMEDVGDMLAECMAVLGTVNEVTLPEVEAVGNGSKAKPRKR